MPREWTADEILALAGGYKAACVLAAAAELELFSALAEGPRTAAQVAGACHADVRGTTILLDALAALELLQKRDGHYTLAPNVAACLTEKGAHSVLAMAQHQAGCVRRWGQLARVVKTGEPTERQPSIRGAQADEAAFITAMDNIGAPLADGLIAEIEPLAFTRVLDVGGGSGTWTIALLRAHPDTRATIFDLPHVIPLAERRLAAAGLLKRVTLVAGDFYSDPLPPGADLAWVSAIAHQNSRDQNRRLFSAVHQALQPGGQIIIRDILMDRSRTAPLAGALFAIHMLVATAGGNAYTFEELRDDLQAAGFTDTTVLRRDEWMNSFLGARAGA